MVRPRVFFDFAIGTDLIGRVIFELFNDTVPKTAENFRALCTGEKGISAVSQCPLYYKNSIIHRSISDFMIQGGDFTKRNGTGGESIYGGNFPDEDLSRPLDAEGLLCMANRGPDTNGSQFFITLRECPHLDGNFQGKHVVFGRVLKGYEEVVKKLAEVPVDEKYRPKLPIVIVKCGELELRRADRSSDVECRPWAFTTCWLFTDFLIKSSKRRKVRSQSSGSERDRRSQRKKPKRRMSESVVGDAQQVELDVHKETEEEYDARLEREERERIEADKRRELERLGREITSRKDGGVRFKGRGRMKFIDPELHYRQ
ncbi:cyclophilin-like domain-containing protein [Pisolithus sp. B1]|nr:cyclophilin-like domain-containing protein [Pisolithus sp. B1]